MTSVSQAPSQSAEVEAKAWAEEARLEVKPEEELPPEATELLERVFEVIKAHPKGLTLPEIGRSLGTDWRGFTSFIKMLVEKGKVWPFKEPLPAVLGVLGELGLV